MNLRECIVFVKERYGNSSIIGAEVGVFAGNHVLDILRNMPNVTILYLVDPYFNAEGVKNKAKRNLSPFGGRVRWVYKQFEKCTREDIPHPLDFIYIDGNHRYEYVKRDIALATQLVKRGGVVGGHDWGSQSVKKAVKEYCMGNKVEVHAAKNVNFGGRDWWFINP